MTKRQDLNLQRRSRPEQSDQRQPDQAANLSHQPGASPDSTSLASRIEFPTKTALARRMDEIERKLRLAGLRAERTELYRIARSRKLSDETARRLVREIDLLEA